MRRTPTPEDPLTVAHRAGNSLATMRDACDAGVDVIEADVRWHRGRLEVRHLKRFGPLPLMWDRWALAPGWSSQLYLEEVLRAMPAHCELMLDIKGGGERFPREVVRTVRELMPSREYSVCSQFWSLLSAFHDDPHARIVHSVGSNTMLRNVLPQLEHERADAVSIHMKLLTPSVVERLFERVSLIMTWPVNREADVRRLQQWGVNGLISDRLELLTMLVAERNHRPTV